MREERAVTSALEYDDSTHEERALTVDDALRALDADLTVSVPVAAVLLGVPRSSLYRYIKCSEVTFQTIELGQRTRVVSASLRALLGLAGEQAPATTTPADGCMCRCTCHTPRCTRHDDVSDRPQTAHRPGRSA